MNADLMNLGFKLLGTLFILNHCRVLVQDKSVKGVSVLSTMYFAGMALYSSWFYHSLDQVYSSVGDLLFFSSQAFWIGLMLYYRRK